MDIETLAHFIELPETHRRILSGYQGAYSLGIGQAVQHGGRHLLILQVENQPGHAFPTEIRLDGEIVPLVVRGNFSTPRAQATSR